MSRKELTVERLRDLLEYEPDTGIFRWKVRNSRSVWPGDVAGGSAGAGYISIRVDGWLYRAHRLAWFHVHGEWPPLLIDHRNGKRDDNRLENLRLASHVDNLANSIKRRHNRSGFKGVFWGTQTKKWQARIRRDGKTTHLGLFDTPEEAHAAYANAAQRVHGEFARAE